MFLIYTCIEFVNTNNYSIIVVEYDCVLAITI